jgi:hypothetical protein
MTIGPIFFASPWALAALAALPLLWLVLKAAPPAPRKVVFPPLRLLLGLTTAEETTGRPPWWLLLARALAAALLIIGFARPSLAPQGFDAVPLSGPLLLVIDDGWTSAPGFDGLRAAALAQVGRAERSGQAVFLLTTAPVKAGPKGPLDAMPAAEARALLVRLEPKPWRPDRGAAAARINLTEARFGEVHWLSDGLNDEDAALLGASLAAKGPATLRTPARAILAISAAEATAKGVAVQAQRATGLSGDVQIAAETLDGRPLGATALQFAPGALETEALIALPAEIAARAARVRIVGKRSAGAVRLIPSAAGRPVVGLADAGGQGQPLLSEMYYVDRAMAPFAQLRRGDLVGLIEGGAQALVLPDASRLAPPQERAMTRWLEAGGLLIRFAGPRLANDADAFTPGPLRRGARQLGGALAWEKPQSLRTFEPESPFFGLEIADDLAIRNHVMLAPEAEGQAQVWARLADGAPIVTARAQGRGMIVLFHVGAGPDWSNLPLSGLYVEMLRRTVSLAGRMPGQLVDPRAASGPFAPRRMIDGFGGWAQAGADAMPIPADQFDAARAGPSAPPGLYERNGAAGAVHAFGPEEELAPLPALDGVAVASFEAPAPRPLAGVFLGLAALLIALDLALALWLSGRLPRWPNAKTATAAVVLIGLAVLAFSPDALAQRRASAPPAGASDLQLAFVRTGDARADQTAKAGLDRLAETLRARTAVEPGATVGVDLARDDLSVYPILYWLAPTTPRPLTDAALANLDRYMRLGGMVFLDTRSGGQAGGQPAAQVLLRGLNAPPLERVGDSHVLTRSFYLLQGFPGRTAQSTLFAETPGAAAARDGVPALLIGDGDWAGVWAQSSAGDALSWYDEDARRRELALRFGVNLVMMALTGNYKADQVHVPALLERLGREEAPR